LKRATFRNCSQRAIVRIAQAERRKLSPRWIVILAGHGNILSKQPAHSGHVFAVVAVPHASSVEDELLYMATPGTRGVACIVPFRRYE
jgi:hypothetical protein